MAPFLCPVIPHYILIFIFENWVTRLRGVIYFMGNKFYSPDKNIVKPAWNMREI